MSQNLPERSLQDSLSLRHPNHFVLAGANNRNVIINYRFLAAPVQVNRCSSHAPGWLSTAHPSEDDGIVNGTVCFHWFSSCCHWLTNIRVRNCSEFYVYELGPPPTCRLRYCGNGGGMLHL